MARQKIKPVRRKKKKPAVKNTHKTELNIEDSTCKLRFACCTEPVPPPHSYLFGQSFISLNINENIQVDSPACHLNVFSNASSDTASTSPCNCTIEWGAFDKDTDVTTCSEKCSGLCNISFDLMASLAEINVVILMQQNLYPGDNVIKFYICSSSLVELGKPSTPYMYIKKESMMELVQFFFNIEFKGYEMNDLYEEEQIQKLYECISNCYDPNFSDIVVSHDYLIPKLRPYQSQAVNWMIKQENPTNKQVGDLHVLYEKISLPDGQVLYFHKYGGYFINSKYAPEEPCRGGILAEEMGLGKTLEVLACTLMHPRNDLIDFEVSSTIISNGSSGSNAEILHPKKKARLSVSTDEFMESSNDSSDNNDHFQCVCDSPYDDDASYTVQCMKCAVIQHAECILYDPSFSGDYVCPHCWIDSCDSIPSKATLIISPASIIYQWQDEILNHIKKKSIETFMYEGVQDQKFVHPYILADYDIVLISYEVLKKELNHVNISHGKDGHSLRLRKKYYSIPSPLCAIEWWRICLDEAQMVESVSTKAAQMVGKLNAVNRWCVTGTPFKKSIEDLYGLLVFLGFKPYDEKLWWKEALLKPFVNGTTSPVTTVLKDIAWRTIKENVSDQTGIPEAERIVHRLKFSPIENIFYERQFVRCKQDFMQKIEKLDTVDIKLTLMDRSSLSKIMMTLKKLQLSCCHCNIRGAGESQNVSTPSDILAYLLNKSKYECEDLFRKLTMAMNGIAGIYVLKENFEEAVQSYELVIQMSEVYEANIRTDVTQKIHSLYHLSNLLINCQKNGQAIKSKYDAVELSSKVDELSNDYVEKSKLTIETCKVNFNDISKEISQIFSVFKLKSKSVPTSIWWIETFERTKEDKEVLVNKLEDVLDNAPGKSIFRKKTLAGRKNRFSVLSILSQIKDMTHDLHETRKDLRKKVEMCAVEPGSAVFNHAISCHLRPVGNVSKCKYCETDDVFKAYETKLFRFEKESNNEDVEITKVRRRNLHIEKQDETSMKTYMRRGINADGDLEIILKFFLNLSRHIKDPDYFADAQNEIKLFDAFKKEFKFLRNLWLAATEYVSHKDEIEMAKISARLLQPGEKPPTPPVPYILFPYEIAPKLVEYQSDKICFMSKFKKKLGSYYYLQNLEKVENKGPSDEVCPVCRQSFERVWSLLQCGHRFCVHCMNSLSSTRSSFIRTLEVSSAGVTCPICRENVPKSGVYYVDGHEPEKDNLEIKGSFSTKTTAIVKCLLQIRKDDAKAKSLVFSSFTDYLSILENAFVCNDIKFVNFQNRKHFKEKLKKFKESEEYNVLLIPLSFGCSGLNIIEANHVLLVEPVMDNSKHLQAIGRIHRIGQTKEVVIHKFIVDKTIEESLFLIEEKKDEELTLQNLVDMFASSVENN